MTEEARRYVLANLADWLIVVVLAWGAVRWGAVPVWIAASIAAAWVLKDGLGYPFMRRYYQSEPPQTRMLGEHGIALTRLEPQGFVRVHGEIWQARLGPRERWLEAGAAVEVRGIEGLILSVDESDVRAPDRHDPSRASSS